MRFTEAINLQISRLRREITPGEDDYFAKAERECRRALALWQEEETERLPEIRELYQRLAEIQQEVRDAVAARLEAETGETGAGIARELRGLSEDNLEEWVIW